MTFFRLVTSFNRTEQFFGFLDLQVNIDFAPIQKLAELSLMILLLSRYLSGCFFSLL